MTPPMTPSAEVMPVVRVRPKRPPTGRPCKRGNIAPRYQKGGQCSCDACRAFMRRKRRTGKWVARAAADMTIDERFWSFVSPEPNSGCWLWTGGDYVGEGYGCFSEGGKAKRAHKWAYERYVGPVPAGLVLDHKCRVRCCANPAHLEPVTHKENARRGLCGVLRKKRHAE